MFMPTRVIKGQPFYGKLCSDWYREWYDVELDPETEILPLIGSKEGIMHICMTYLNEGDKCWCQIRVILLTAVQYNWPVANVLIMN